MSQSKKMAKVFKALSHPHRLDLFLNILEQKKMNIQAGEKERPCLLTEFFSQLKVGAPTISHHVKELVHADLIETEKQGKFLVCQVNTSTLKEMKKILTLINRIT